MLFSTRSEYGVMVMSDLARNYGRGPRSLTEIAADLGLADKAAYLEQIIPPLKAYGFIESQRGVKGGYVLALPPEKIQMGAVIRALEEKKNTKSSLNVMPCATLDGSADSCDHVEKCSGPVLWLRVRDAITQALDSTTLADLVPETRRSLPLLTVKPPPVISEALEVGVAGRQS